MISHVAYMDKETQQEFMQSLYVMLEDFLPRANDTTGMNKVSRASNRKSRQGG
jgi:hypothetical protein